MSVMIIKDRDGFDLKIKREHGMCSMNIQDEKELVEVYEKVKEWVERIQKEKK